MNADIKGSLAQIERSYKAFVHNGKSMTKSEVKAVLMYGIAKGYKTTNEFTAQEIDTILNHLTNGK